MSPDEFATRVRKRLKGPAADKVAAAIIADAGQLMAWGIEQHAHPAYPPRLAAVLGVGQEEEQEQATSVTELPGAPG